jgi:hydrogenase nickel incorporation protein HypA/HybF
MHELSIALSIIDGVTEEAERRGGVRVGAVHLKLGPLSGVDKGALSFAYELAREGTCVEKARLVVEDIAVVVYCPSCCADRTLEDLQRFCCPVCDSPTSQVVHGRELEISALEIEA